MNGDTVHFYYVSKSPASVLDCGIGICHFYETEKFNQQSGVFEEMENHPAPPENLIYLVSYKKSENI